jgi:hypothetical protein
MARFMLTHAAVGPGARRLRAGQTVADTLANAQAGDFVWVGLTGTKMPLGMTPLDASGSTMRGQSTWAALPVATVCTGADSIDA